MAEVGGGLAGCAMRASAVAMRVSAYRLGSAVRPRNGRTMLYRYRLYLEDGSEAGEATTPSTSSPARSSGPVTGAKLRPLLLGA
jgi:hypothetical protein